MEKLAYPKVDDNEANALLNPSQSQDISNSDTISPGAEDAPINMKAEQIDTV